jgi:hypothetical protein
MTPPFLAFSSSRSRPSQEGLLLIRRRALVTVAIILVTAWVGASLGNTLAKLPGMSRKTFRSYLPLISEGFGNVAVTRKPDVQTYRWLRMGRRV